MGRKLSGEVALGENRPPESFLVSNFEPKWLQSCKLAETGSHLRSHRNEGSLLRAERWGG